MGVKNLFRLYKESVPKATLKDFEETKTLIIDGSALVFDIKRNLTSYKEVFEKATACFDTLASHFTEILYVVESASEKSKFECHVDRMQQKVSSLVYGKVDVLDCISLGSDFVPPDCAYRMVTEAASKHQSVTVITCPEHCGDIDAVIASIAISKNGLVLSNDSDFIIYPVQGLLPLLHFNWFNPSGSPVNSSANLIKALKIHDSMLPWLAVVMGCDYVNVTEKNKPNVTPIVEALRLGEPGMEPIDVFKLLASKLETLETHEEELLQAIKNYTIKNDPKLAYNEITDFRLQTIINDQVFWCSPVFEDFKLCSWDTSIPVRQMLYSALGLDKVTEFSRLKYNIVQEDIEAVPLFEWKDKSITKKWNLLCSSFAMESVGAEFTVENLYDLILQVFVEKLNTRTYTISFVTPEKQQTKLRAKDKNKILLYNEFYCFVSSFALLIDAIFGTEGSLIINQVIRNKLDIIQFCNECVIEEKVNEKKKKSKKANTPAVSGNIFALLGAGDE